MTRILSAAKVSLVRALARGFFVVVRMTPILSAAKDPHIRKIRVLESAPTRRFFAVVFFGRMRSKSQILSLPKFCLSFRSELEYTNPERSEGSPFIASFFRSFVFRHLNEFLFVRLVIIWACPYGSGCRY